LISKRKRTEEEIKYPEKPTEEECIRKQVKQLTAQRDTHPSNLQYVRKRRRKWKTYLRLRNRRPGMNNSVNSAPQTADCVYMG
jgi:hypothetical protein